MTDAPRLKSDSSVPAFPARAKVGERFHRTYREHYTRDQSRELRATVQVPGTIRTLWQNLAGYVGAASPFSWTRNGRDIDPAPRAAGGVSTPLRYLVSTVDVLTAGNQRSNPMRRPVIPPRVTHTPPSLVMAGNVGYRPTIRSRVPSFGSRVPSLNQGLGIAGTE